MDSLMNKYAVSIDIGSSGGKLVAATLDSGKLQFHAEFVFDNRPTEILGSIYLNPLGIYMNILEGLRRFSRLDGQIETIGLDGNTGMYGYLDKYGCPKYTIHSSRDVRLNHILPDMEKRMSRWEQYRASGVPPFPRNIFSQLYCDVLEDEKAVDRMETILGMPDLQDYFLTGIKQSERSFSSITGMMSPGGNDWNYDLLKTYSIPTHLFLPVKSENAAVGPLAGSIANSTNCSKAVVVQAAEHDTAAAVAAIPMLTQNDVFLSLGSTIILGMQCDQPIVTEMGLLYHFKNASMAFGKTIYMRDITGFWILDECIKVWKAQGCDVNPAHLTGLAKSAKENFSFFNVDDLVFASFSENMPKEIQNYCEATGQPVPKTVGEIVRCIFESCALRVRYCYEGLCRITNRENFDSLTAVGGGIRNGLLCQTIADALQSPLTAGNPMASSAGNLLTQFLAIGAIKSLEEMREIAKNTFTMLRYIPDFRNRQKWEDAFQFMISHGYFDGVSSTRIKKEMIPTEKGDTQ
jgi:rhamnulokinase